MNTSKRKEVTCRFCNTTYVPRNKTRHSCGSKINDPKSMCMTFTLNFGGNDVDIIKKLHEYAISCNIKCDSLSALCQEPEDKLAPGNLTYIFDDLFRVFTSLNNLKIETRMDRITGLELLIGEYIYFKTMNSFDNYLFHLRILKSTFNVYDRLHQQLNTNIPQLLNNIENGIIPNPTPQSIRTPPISHIIEIRKRIKTIPITYLKRCAIYYIIQAFGQYDNQTFGQYDHQSLGFIQGINASMRAVSCVLDGFGLIFCQNSIESLLLGNIDLDFQVQPWSNTDEPPQKKICTHNDVDAQEITTDKQSLVIKANCDEISPNIWDEMSNAILDRAVGIFNEINSNDTFITANFCQYIINVK